MNICEIANALDFQEEGIFETDYHEKDISNKKNISNCKSQFN